MLYVISSFDVYFGYCAGLFTVKFAFVYFSSVEIATHELFPSGFSIVNFVNVLRERVVYFARLNC
jgi:hypothetical protein